MITREEIIKLAKLSRLSLSDDEITHMQKDMGAILAYVDKLKSAQGVETGPVMSRQKNVLRADENPIPAHTYTDKLLKLAPRTETLYFKVKKILGGSSQ